MSLLRKSDIFHLPLVVWEYLGVIMNYRSLLLTCYSTLNIIIMGTVLIFVLASFLQENSDSFAKIMESVFGILHSFLKYMLFIYYKADVEYLLRERSESFKTDSKLTLDLNDKTCFKKSEESYGALILLQKCYLFSLIVCFILFWLRPILYKDQVYILETWEIKNSIIFCSAMLFVHYYVLLLAMSLIFGYDLMYLSFCVYAVVELRDLKYKMKGFTTNSPKNAERSLINCIRKHQALKLMVKRINSIYSIILLLHYFITLGISCADLYELMGKPDNSIDVPQLMTLLITFAEFAFYAFPAEQVVFELLELSKAIYMSKWYEQPLETQKLIVLVMADSQRTQYFLGGDVVIVNMDIFGKAVRNAFTFYAVLRKFLNK